jgi:hypothetical protein
MYAMIKPLSSQSLRMNLQLALLAIVLVVLVACGNRPAPTTHNQANAETAAFSVPPPYASGTIETIGGNVLLYEGMEYQFIQPEGVSQRSTAENIGDAFESLAVALNISNGALMNERIAVECIIIFNPIQPDYATCAIPGKVSGEISSALEMNQEQAQGIRAALAHSFPGESTLLGIQRSVLLFGQ